MKRRGRKSASQTPSPKKDRIYGSKKNPPKSATSEKASSIKLSSEVVDRLKKKLKEFKKENPNKDNITLSDLKAVNRRGAGAYSSSHRPTIKGGKPNTRSAWAMARVNKFLKKASGKKVKKAYVQDDDLMKYEGGGLLAPNGKPSNLTLEQYKLVRTPEFKAWFGDWENDPENASKVVDENGEPLVVYHGTFRDFNIFEVSKDGGFYFTEFKRIANIYASIVQEGKISKIANENPRVISCFLNVKKIFKENIYGIVGRNVARINKAIKKGYDGLLLKGGQDVGGYYDQYIVFNSNQIKLADGTNTTFDGNNPDIRYEGGGKANNGRETFYERTYADGTTQKFGVEEYEKGMEVDQNISKLLDNFSGSMYLGNYLGIEKPNFTKVIGSITIKREEPFTIIETYKIKNFIENVRKKQPYSDIIKDCKVLENVIILETNSYEQGGELDSDKKETYQKWKKLVNMSKSELEAFYNSKEGKEAGLSPSEAKNQGIDSGRESARWIMRMKDTPVKDWTPNMWRWAKKQISFISRMSGNKGKLYDAKGRKTRKHTSLLIWGHNPEK